MAIHLFVRQGSTVAQRAALPQPHGVAGGRETELARIFAAELRDTLWLDVSAKAFAGVNPLVRWSPTP